MILAYCQLPEIKIPDLVVKQSLRYDLDTFHMGLPMDATCWIASRHVWPHTDDSWKESLFLILIVRGDHKVRDIKNLDDYRSQPPGTLLVVDPMVVHWLEPHEFDSGVSQPWIGLEWEVPRRHAKKKAREIVAELGGQWEIDDKRYKTWQPKTKAV